MANGVVVQSAVVLAVALLVCVIVAHRLRSARSRNVSVMRPLVVEKSETALDAPKPILFVSVPQDAEPVIETVAGEPQSTSAPVTAVGPAEAVPELPVVVQAHPAVQEDRNQRILAGISENIRKTQFKPVATYSPLQYPEKTRETEYVRIKKQIITPHGQIRFSILKDSISTNMLAVFRRASMEWKTANDLIGFVPSYLEPEAEILNDQLLLIGTPGHNEKLAIPIRSVDGAALRDCFDFVTDPRAATNTPAVLVASDTEFEVVSRGVITQPVFGRPLERPAPLSIDRRPEMQLLAEATTETETGNPETPQTLQANALA